MICNGYAQGIGLICRCSAAAGATPARGRGPVRRRRRPCRSRRAAGLEVVGVPVDADGIRVDALERIDADALVLTPSHQWPTGGVLAPDRRAAVLRWARERGALVVEDDYDAEYRYDRAPIGADAGPRARTASSTPGPASKTLAPGLRLGWLVAAAALVDPLAAAKRLADRGSPVLDQLAFADFLPAASSTATCAGCGRFTAAAATRCSPRCGEHLPELEPAGIAAGLHLVAWLPAEPRRDGGRRGRGAGAASRSTAWRPTASPAPGRPGLIFGYATLGERALAAGSRSSPRRSPRALASAAAGSGRGAGMPCSLWNGTVSVGLGHVPVKLYSATESKTIHFHEVHLEDGARTEHRCFGAEGGTGRFLFDELRYPGTAPRGHRAQEQGKRIDRAASRAGSMGGWSSASICR